MYENGDKYEGNFQEGKRHGPGTYWHKDSNDIYDGNWLNN